MGAAQNISTDFLTIPRGNNTRTAVYLLGFALVIQIVDTSAVWKDIREALMTEPKAVWVTPMVDPFWEKAGAKYKKVRWIPPRNTSPQWLPIAAYAGTHRLATDAVYLTRVGTLALEQGNAWHRMRLNLADMKPTLSMFWMKVRFVRQLSASTPPPMYWPESMVLTYLPLDGKHAPIALV